MTESKQQLGGKKLWRIRLCLSLASLSLFSSCETSDVSKSPSEIAKPLSETEKSRQIERVPVTSSNLQSVGYDAVSQKLTVEFRNGSVYEYGNVPPEVHAELMQAKSHGKYFHSHIRNAGFASLRVH